MRPHICDKIGIKSNILCYTPNSELRKITKLENRGIKCQIIFNLTRGFIYFLGGFRDKRIELDRYRLYR